MTAFRLVAVLSFYFLITGCATIVKGTTQGIPITSEPTGADVVVDGMLVGTTPTDVEMKRKRDHLVTIQKDGYQPKSVPVVKDIGGAVWGNIIAGGLIGWGVDATSGAQNNLNPKTISVQLVPISKDGAAPRAANDSSVAIKKLNDLDQMLENEQISDEEYGRARLAILKEYFPEMVPTEAEEDAPESGESVAEQ
jgi:hypothetical protein